METTFTPVEALLGGALIGLASVALMALFGRIMGATAIFEGVFRPESRPDWIMRASLLVGMALAPLVILGLTGQMPLVQAEMPMAQMIIGGVIVGVGVVFGSGCTSGHGVCGIARFSRRSIVATVTFMATTALTVYALRLMTGG